MPQQGGINAPYAGFRGPVLVGQSSDFGIAAVNGGSTAPLISFWNASEHGYYVESSSETRFVSGGASATCIYTSGGVKVGSSALYTASATGSMLFIPQSTAIMSSGTAPTGTLSGAALVFAISSDSTSRGKLWIYSTVTANWMGTTALTWTTTST